MERAVRQQEQERLLRDLHDTVKQNVHGITLLLESCLRSEASRGEDAVQKRIGEALELSRDADHQLSKPMEELKFLQNGATQGFTAFFAERLRQFGERFGIDTHEDLRAPLEQLSHAQAAAAYRIFVEASWNVVKHSRASGLSLESRREGSGFSLRLWDDGRGFCVERATGMGLRFMRSRAEEVGATLSVFSQPGWGTGVEVSFERANETGDDT